MLSSTIIKQYAKDHGYIESKYSTSNERRIACLRLRNRTLFNSYLKFLKSYDSQGFLVIEKPTKKNPVMGIFKKFLAIEQTDETEDPQEVVIGTKDQQNFENFFHVLTYKGGSPAAIVCASVSFAVKKATHIESKEGIPPFDAKGIKQTCRDWDISIDEALLFATLEYTTDMSGHGEKRKRAWPKIIDALLTLDVNPNFSSDKFLTVMPKDGWVMPAEKLTSAILILLNKKTHDAESLGFIKKFKDKIKSRGERVFSTKMAFSSIVPTTPAGIPIFDHPLFVELESHDPDQMKKYIQKNYVAIIASFVTANDMETIDRLRKQYSLEYNYDVFHLLLQFQWNYKPKGIGVNCAWVDRPIFKYLEKEFFDRLQTCLEANDIIKELCVIDKKHDYQADYRYYPKNTVKLCFSIDEESIFHLHRRFGINPVPVLMAEAVELSLYPFQTDIFAWLEEHFQKEIRAYLHANLWKICAQWRYPDTEAYPLRQIKGKDYFAEKYDIDSNFQVIYRPGVFKNPQPAPLEAKLGQEEAKSAMRNGNATS